jgi:hypothetical protein
LLFKGGVGALTLGASVWLVGGLRDFRSDRGQPALAAPDTVLSAADSLLQAGSTGAPEPIGAETASSAAVKRRPRRPAPPEAPTPVSVSIDPHDPVRAGDTITLAAVVLDGSNQPLAEADVAWASREPELATVDSTTGKVLAKASGTARIIAQSGPHSATLELTVLPAHQPLPDTSGYVPLDAEPSREETPLETAWVPPLLPPSGPPPGDNRAGPPTADPPVDRRELESRIRDGVSRCYDAVRSKNLDRLASMYHPETESDEDKLKRLSRILRTEPWQATVGKRVDGARELEGRTAAAEFSFRLTWRDAFGGRLVSQPIFRAEFARSDKGWTLSSCRIVGSPKL